MLTSPSERIFEALKNKAFSLWARVEKVTIGELIWKEWFVFLSVNVFFPHIASLFLSISYNHTFRLVFVLVCATLILLANINRINRAQSLKKLYIVFAVLNVLSFPLAGGMSFLTTLDMWPLVIVSVYEITLGDGYAHGWPFELN